MLLKRSVLYKICIALIFTQAKCDFDYEAEEGSEDAETQEQPDYSKYFSEDTSAPLFPQLEKSEFGSPSQYKYFFAGSPSGESAKDAPEPKQAEPFTAFEGFASSPSASEHDPLTRDFFEESQKKQKENTQNLHAEQSEIQPGPHYVSHQVPIPLRFQDEIKAASKNQDKTLPAAAQDVEKHVREEAEEIDIVQQTEDQIAKIRMETLPTYGKKNVDYSIGKSSSTVSQYPTATTLFEQSRIADTAAFNPSNEEALSTKYLEILATSPSPYVPSYKSDVDFGGYAAQNRQNAASTSSKNCRKIEKGDSDNMDCYVCEDLVNKEKFTQCSLVSEPSEPVNFYAGVSERYSGGSKSPFGYRNRRSPRTDEEAEDDPYEEVRRRSLAMISKFDEEHEAAESERKKDFLYKPYGGHGSSETSYSESASANLAKNPENCQQVEKEDGNTCTVCKDPKTGDNFERCSYTEKPKAQKFAYVAEKSYDSEDESSPVPVVKTSSYRSRRSPRSHDPYGEFGYRGKKGDKGDHYSGYDYSPYYDESESYAETQDETLKLNPADCQKVDRKGMTCTVCKDAKTGGNFEQCSYTSAPKEHKYAYSAEKKYDGDTPEPTEETKNVEKEAVEKQEEYPEEAKSISTEDDKSSAESKETKETKDDHSHYYFPNEGDNSDKKSSASDSYDIPYPYAASSNNKKTADDFDSYHYKLFPELLNKEESRNQENQQPHEDNNKQDVEDVLAEFSKKDRSKCKKAEKNGMTCFQCTDKNKVQHEECMYVQESKPKATHVAYHEVQRLKDDPEGDKEAVTSETQQTTETGPVKAESREEQIVEQVTTAAPATLDEPAVAASEEVKKIIKPKKPYHKKKKRFIKRNNKHKEPVVAASAVDSERLEDAPATAATADSERLEDSERTPKTPAEFDVGQDEGAFSAETKPVYSKTFGTNLPKYMVEKTEFEKEFDEASGFGW